ncbi:hypothetical protein Vi05172_g9067 [Venturia inaequalis]|nr:hypothetical protein Vi05172_g9067 [Venturia inaequalis]
MLHLQNFLPAPSQATISCPSPTQEPRPAVYYPILNITFPYDLNDSGYHSKQRSRPSLIPELNSLAFFRRSTASLSSDAQQTFIAQVIANVPKVINSTSGLCCRNNNAPATGQIMVLASACGIWQLWQLWQQSDL